MADAKALYTRHIATFEKLTLGEIMPYDHAIIYAACIIVESSNRQAVETI